MPTELPGPDPRANVELWYRNVEQDPDFRNQSRTHKQQRREEYFKKYVAPLAKNDPRLLRELRSNLFPSLGRSFVSGMEQRATALSGGDEAAIRLARAEGRLRGGEAEANRKEAEYRRKSSITPMANPLASMMGGMALDLPLMMAGSSLARNVITGAGTLTGLGRQALTFATPALATPTASPMEYLTNAGVSGLMGVAGFGPKNILVGTGLAGGLGALLSPQDRLKGAAEAGLMTLGMRALGAAPAPISRVFAKAQQSKLLAPTTRIGSLDLMTGKRIAKLERSYALRGKITEIPGEGGAPSLPGQEEFPAPPGRFKQGLPNAEPLDIRESNFATPTDLVGITKPQVTVREALASDLSKYNQSILVRSSRVSDELTKRLEAMQFPELSSAVESATNGIRKAIATGGEVEVQSAYRNFQRVTLLAEQRVGNLPLEQRIGGDATIVLSGTGQARLLSQGLAPTDAAVLHRINDKPPQLSLSTWNELSDVVDPRIGYSPRDSYLAHSLLGPKGSIDPATLQRTGETTESFASYIRTLRTAGLLDEELLVVPGIEQPVVSLTERRLGQSEKDRFRREGKELKQIGMKKGAFELQQLTPKTPSEQRAFELAKIFEELENTNLDAATKGKFKGILSDEISRLMKDAKEEYKPPAMRAVPNERSELPDGYRLVSDKELSERNIRKDLLVKNQARLAKDFNVVPLTEAQMLDILGPEPAEMLINGKWTLVVESKHISTESLTPARAGTVDLGDGLQIPVNLGGAPVTPAVKSMLQGLEKYINDNNPLPRVREKLINYTQTQLTRYSDYFQGEKIAGNVHEQMSFLERLSKNVDRIMGIHEVMDVGAQGVDPIVFAQMLQRRGLRGRYFPDTGVMQVELEPNSGKFETVSVGDIHKMPEIGTVTTSPVKGVIIAADKHYWIVRGENGQMQAIERQLVRKKPTKPSGEGGPLPAPPPSEIEYLPPGGAAEHAEAGGWSPEALNRPLKFFVLNKNTGKTRPLIGVEAVDYQPIRGEVKYQTNTITGKTELTSLGPDTTAPRTLPTPAKEARFVSREIAPEKFEEKTGKMVVNEQEYEAMKDMLYANKGYYMETILDNRQAVVHDLRTGERKVMSVDEMGKLASDPDLIIDFTPEYTGAPMASSYNASARVRKPPTDPSPSEPSGFTMGFMGGGNLEPGWELIKKSQPVQTVQRWREEFKQTQIHPRYLLPKKNLFAIYDKRFGEKYGLPIETSYQTSRAYYRGILGWQMRVHPIAKTLIKDLEKANQDGIASYIRAGEVEMKAGVKRRFGLTDADLKVAQRSEVMLQEVFGKYWREMYRDDIPNYVADGTKSPPLSTWMEKGGLHPTEDRLSTLLANGIASRARLSLTNGTEQIDYIIHRIDKLPEAIEPGMDARFASQIMSPQLKGTIIKDLVNYKAQLFFAISSDRAAADTFLRSIYKTAGITADERLFNKVLPRLMLMSYAGTLPFRTGIIFRNLTQTFTTTLLYSGVENYSRGVARMFTKEGQALGRELGLHEFQHTPQLQQMNVEGKMWTGLRKFYDFGMRPMNASDYFNRVLSANIGYASVERWAPKYLSGELTSTDFLRKTGLVYLEPSIKDYCIKPLMSQGRAGLVETAKRFGANLSEDTQWLYHAGNTSQLFDSIPGRFLGQFATWPTNYLRFLVRGVRSGDRMASLTFMARWFVINEALLQAGQHVFGIDPLGWLFLGPLQYAGGPGAQLVRNTADLIAGPDYRRQMAWGELKKLGLSFAPGYGVYRDVKKVFEAETAPEAFKGMLGFRSYED